MTLNKKEIAAYAAAVNGAMSNKAAEEVVDAVFERIAAGLQDGDEVSIHGFGKFVTVVREARTGRNPQTGEAIQIAAKTAVQFKPAKQLKDLVQ